MIAQGVDVGAIVNGYDILSATALSPWQQDTDIEIIRLLLAVGANPNICSENGKPALYWAAVKDEKELVRLLIYAGATVEAEQPKDGYTSLHIAAQNNNIEITELLLSTGGKIALNKFE